MEVQFSQKAVRFLSKSNDKQRERIIKKLEWIISQKDILHFAKPVVHMPPATHCCRIGQFRMTIALDHRHERMVIFDIDIRGRIYKK